MSEWTLDGLVWPWCMDRFTGSKGDKMSVTEALSARRFPVRQLATTPPAEGLQLAAGKVLVQLLNAKDKEAVPWALMLSDGPAALQAIANLIPVGYSLTTLGSCAVTSTSQLMDLFFSKRPMDAFEPDPDGEVLHEIQVAGFLSWMNVNSAVSGTAHQSGRFASLMEYRLKHRLLTLMTAPYTTWSAATRGEIDAQITKAAGVAVGAMMKDVPIINLKAPKIDRLLSTLEV